jgi:hypothetical protein
MSFTPIDPYARGRAAFRVGIPRDAVPYPSGAESDQWKKGWDFGYGGAYPNERLR